MKKIIISLLIAIFGLIFLIPQSSSARDASQITDWYIKDFQSEIIVNKDSSLDIIENIVADCGNLPDKHGIFRILPLFYQKTATERAKTPVTLTSIADFNGTPYHYTETRNRDTVTWKIGDPNQTVTGLNNYRIMYHVKNTIRFDNANFDEFYWNLIGNFWKIDIDAAVVTVKFPSAITRSNSNVVLYTGLFGQKGTDATSTWLDENTLQVVSTKGMRAGEGMTASVTFPKNIVTPYIPSWFEKYGQYPWLLLPVIVFLICFNLWRKFGRDPKLGRTIIAEYEPPENISPLEMGLIMSNRSFSNKFISASLINLAVKKIIKIEEIPKKGLLGKKDFKLTLVDDRYSESKTITESEKYLLGCLLEYAADSDKQKTVMLSDLANKFYTHLSSINKKARNETVVAKSFSQAGFTYRIIMIIAGGVILGGFFWLAVALGLLFDSGVWFVILSIIGAGLILIVFAILMPQRTAAGAELLWRVKGFKLYMGTAEKYRERFNEKENIFEKYLPYAMVFGIVGLWIEKMKMIYGENYFNTYHPIWYAGYVGDFNADTFADSMNEVSSNMAATLASSPSSSGSAGGGSSGGGGGGGGGGGW